MHTLRQGFARGPGDVEFFRRGCVRLFYRCFTASGVEWERMRAQRHESMQYTEYIKYTKYTKTTIDGWQILSRRETHYVIVIVYLLTFIPTSYYYPHAPCGVHTATP